MSETPHDETRDFLIDLLPTQRRPLLHLLDCEECKAFGTQVCCGAKDGSLMIASVPARVAAPPTVSRS